MNKTIFSLYKRTLNLCKKIDKNPSTKVIKYNKISHILEYFHLQI